MNGFQDPDRPAVLTWLLPEVDKQKHIPQKAPRIIGRDSGLMWLKCGAARGTYIGRYLNLARVPGDHRGTSVRRLCRIWF